MRKLFWSGALLAVVFTSVAATTNQGCDEATPPIQSTSGLTKAQVTVPTGPDGLSVEQRNVRDRLLQDNKPGSIKHLYVISAYSGQVLLYSTVKGKVTSSGKRLDPSEIYASYDNEAVPNGFAVSIGGHNYLTKQVLGADGTYGDSIPYVYWFDARGVYHQHYIEGGQILHVSSEPIAVKNIVLNLEATASDAR